MSHLCDCQLTVNPRVICESHQIALQELLEQSNDANITRATAALQQLALGLAGMTGIAVQDVPRLVVQTACIGVEKLIETYTRRQNALSLEEQGAMKIMIVEAAKDLQRALDEGLDTARQILTSLDGRLITAND